MKPDYLAPRTEQILNGVTEQQRIEMLIALGLGIRTTALLCGMSKSQCHRLINPAARERNNASKRKRK